MGGICVRHRLAHLQDRLRQPRRGSTDRYRRARGERRPEHQGQRAGGSGEGFAVNLAEWGYTDEEAVEAFKDSDIVQVVWGELPPVGDGRIQKRGVSFGWYVYVTLSQSQARATCSAARPPLRASSVSSPAVSAEPSPRASTPT
ncbi:hypothetical protein GCM10010388_72540 [Streptomyces mauvecolor]|uniref:hypothetical protein n=1 Tax=Streptomyces mauvecolor TaxID=58345 RepID=UPI0031DE1530